MSIRRRLRITVGLAALVAATLTALSTIVAHAETPKALPSFDRVMTLPAPRDVGDLPMTDQHGARKRLADYAGSPTLVFFGFTHCPDACPATLQRLALLKKSKPRELAGMRVLLISVDGERDTPEALRGFLARFDKDFVGLTAPAGKVRELALRFSAPFFKDPPKDGGYLVQHSTRVYALDKHGKLRAEMFDASADATASLVQALQAE